MKYCVDIAVTFKQQSANNTYPEAVSNLNETEERFERRRCHKRQACFVV